MTPRLQGRELHIGIDASRAISLDWGGPENYSYFLIRALARVDRLNHYSLYINSKPPRDLVSQENFRMRLVPWPRFYTQGGLSLECFLRKPDVLFIPAHTIPFVRPPHLTTVVTIHDLAAQFLEQFYQFPGRLYLNRATEYCAHHATRIIAVSESTRQDIVEKFQVDPQKITVVYEGYDRGIFKRPSRESISVVRRKYQLDRDYLLSVGTVQPRKNYLRLIHAFFKISKEEPSLDLIIVGKRGWLCDEIYSLPSILGLAERVKFLGHVPDEDLAALYGGAKVFIFPSLYEGFGLVPLEAMACGTPVVLSSLSSLPEVGGDAVIYVDPYSIESIANGMMEVLSFNSLSREAIIDGGLRRAAGFSWERAAVETIGVFKDAVLAGGRWG